jgi:hypothetical protein
MAVKTTIQFRRDTEANWAGKTLADGEIGYVNSGTNKGKFKIGDGVTVWGTLPFAPSGNADTATKLQTAITVNGTTGVDWSASSYTFTAAAGTLTGTTLNSSVVTSSLTSVGTIASGTWSASFGAVSGANLTNLTAANLTGTISSTVLGNSNVYIGSTAVPLNRATGNLGLTGISSITFPGGTSGTVQIIPTSIAGSTVLTLPGTTGTVARIEDLPVASNANPLVNGTANAGTSVTYSRADHIHPTDTTLAPKASPTFTGTISAVAVNLTGSLGLRSTTVTTANSAPLYFNSSSTSVLATPEVGAVEYDGSIFYATTGATGAANRGLVPSTQYYTLNSTRQFTLPDVNANAIFAGSGSGASLAANTTYEFEGLVRYSIYTGTAVGSNYFLLNYSGTAASSAVTYTSTRVNNTTTPVPGNSWGDVGTSNIGTKPVNALITIYPNPVASSNNFWTVYFKGIIRTTTSGVLTPQMAMNPITGISMVTVDANSYWKVTNIGNNTVTSIGAWA